MWRIVFTRAFWISLTIHLVLVGLIAFVMQIIPLPDRDQSKIEVIAVDLSISGSVPERENTESVPKDSVPQEEQEKGPVPEDSLEEDLGSVPQGDLADLGSVPENTGSVPEQELPEQEALDSKSEVENCDESDRNDNVREDISVFVRTSPKAMSFIKPEYPRVSRRRGEQGAVTIRAQISSEGKVISAVVVSTSGYPRLDDAARRATETARFIPAQEEGRPVAATIDLPFVFTL